MEDFDIQISMNGVENELNSNFIEKNRVMTVSASPKNNIEVKSAYNTTDIRQKPQIKKFFSFEGEQEKDKSWIDSLNNITKVFKDATGYQTIKQQQEKNEKELAERGKKYKVLGMNPFVAIGVSLVVIIGTSIAVTKIKAG